MTRTFAPLLALLVLASCQPAGVLYNWPDTPPPVYRWGVETGGDTSVVLGWSDWTTGEIAYVVQAQGVDGSWTPTDCEPAHGAPGTGTPLAAVVEKLSGESVYIFRVVALGTVFASPSAPIEITTGPIAPVSLSAVYNPPNVDLSWTDAANTETGYLVQRGNNREYFVTIAALGPGTESYQNASVPTGVYYYRVYAEGTGSNSSAPVVGPVVVP